MPRQRSFLRNAAEYAALRGVQTLMHFNSMDQNLHIAGEIGSMLWRGNIKRRERTCMNIARSFPDWCRDRVEHVGEGSMRHMVQVFMVDALFTPRLLNLQSWPSYIDVSDLGDIVMDMFRHEPMLLVTGHCGNWEILGFHLSLMGLPVNAVARPLDNPFLNDWLLGAREARGMNIITKWGATPALQETLRRGEMLGFIADQNAGDGGLFVPFFGRLASSYKSIALLAMRHKVPVAAGFARRLNGMRYDVSVTDLIRPEDWEGQPDPVFYITARYSRAIEMMIRTAPEQYLWLHRRWKSRPRHERLDRPFPDRLREKLEALPWMTEDELGRIVRNSAIDRRQFQEGGIGREWKR